MKMNLIVAVFLLLFGGYSSAFAQQTDSIAPSKTVEEIRKEKKEIRHQRFLNTLPKNHNPKTATLLALIPGGGQIYNRRYWKLPLVYGSLGTLGYLSVSNYIEYGCFRKAYLHAVDDNPNTNYTCDLAPTATAPNLKIYRNTARTNAETFLLLSILIYGLSITDAFVDAHLMHFDIDDDLSLQISPQLQYDFKNKDLVPSLGLIVLQQNNPKNKCLPVEF